MVTNGLIGLAVGDALGVPVEFMDRHTYAPVTKMQGYGTHNQPPGTWSDDSSMAFCTAESLINGYDLIDMKGKFCEWYYDGFWTHNHKLPFDIGITTARVLLSIKMGNSQGVSGERSEFSNGNGSLMRILPVAFYTMGLPLAEKFRMVEEISAITHAHIRSQIACAIYVEMAQQLMVGKTPWEAYEAMKPVIMAHYFKEQNHEELAVFSRVLIDDLSKLEIDEIKSSGYVIDTLEASIWCLLTTDSFSDAVLKAVNLGEDTDTVGAVTGGLAGIHYGAEAIPQDWLQQLARYGDIVDLSMRLAESIRN